MFDELPHGSSRIYRYGPLICINWLVISIDRVEKLHVKEDMSLTEKAADLLSWQRRPNENGMRLLAENRIPCNCYTAVTLCSPNEVCGCPEERIFPDMWWVGRNGRNQY
eukprot:scaffold2710_cov168-Skeletonema_marinoi.AAC.7